MARRWTDRHCHPGAGFSPIFYALLATFTVAARDLKRLDSNAASKRITCFTDLITGVVTVRAFGSSSAYFATLMERLDENMIFYFWQGTVRQWQMLLVSLASSGVVIATVLVVTLTPGLRLREQDLRSALYRV